MSCKPKHTPGPWTYPLGTGILIGGPDHLLVAQVGTEGRTPEERQANAHLIAVAPELVEALLESVNYTAAFHYNDKLHGKRGCPGEQDCDLPSAVHVRKTRAALRKAGLLDKEAS